MVGSRPVATASVPTDLIVRLGYIHGRLHIDHEAVATGRDPTIHSKCRKNNDCVRTQRLICINFLPFFFNNSYIFVAGFAIRRTFASSNDGRCRRETKGESI